MRMVLINDLVRNNLANIKYTPENISSNYTNASESEISESVPSHTLSEKLEMVNFAIEQP